MPRKKFDKKSATTYQLLYREQNDPHLHDEGASSMVLHEVQSKKPRKGRNRSELEAELFGEGLEGATEVPGFRDNEGEAAEHGVYFDDTEYDYMQHLRDLDSAGAGPSVWIEAPTTQNKGKGKMELEEALKAMDLADGKAMSKITDASILPSAHLRKTTYQDQQDIPDALAGFQPDMDPRLREVLEALEDDAYVETDAKDDTFFTSIAEGGEELSLDEFERSADDDEEDWESDDTAKPEKEYAEPSLVRSTDDAGLEAKLATETDEDHGDGEFMANFRNLPKASRKAKINAPGSMLTASSALTAGGKHKKRKGAMTSSDSYSMTSSALARTDALSTLDARFEKTLESYMEDEEDGDFADDDMSLASGRLSNISGVSGLSKASVNSRASQASSLADNDKFNNIMDEFLGDYSHTGKRRVVKGKPQTGMQQLDEIRKELGPARRPATKVGPS